MWPFLVVVSAPSFQFLLGIHEAPEPMGVDLNCSVSLGNVMDWELYKAGDRVTMPDGIEGTVVANFECNEFSEAVTKEGWNNDEGGLLRFGQVSS